MNVYIQTGNITDMKWPCPDWFHVPLSTEWQWLKTIMDWLGLTTWDSWRINLHMPFAGCRMYSNADPRNQRDSCYYWSSSPNSAGSDSARSLSMGWSSNVNADRSDFRAYGYSVRCFKNSFELPTSSWTVINGTLWSAWIFWNQSEWLISITNWTTGYTIQDKNLWATTVYNDWNTLSKANCGKYYQWGNNYWFAWTWSVTTSSTKVDASTYWPWNYYSSSTFITWSYDWSSVHNDNLRWWETWPVSMNELQNAYIGEYVEPDYLCFTANTANSTVQLTQNWTPTAVSLETSTDWETWSAYTIGSTITLSNIWDKVYFRNTSETTTGFSKDSSNLYKFTMSWGIAASWDVNYLLNKNSTTTLSNNCFIRLFHYCTSLTTAPSLPATNLENLCYYQMFQWCSNLITAPALPATTLASHCYWYMFTYCSNLMTLPNLPATTLASNCYYGMFIDCSKIKLSSTKTWDYQTAYRIPTTWTWVTASDALTNMFYDTWWTFTSDPTINTTYYTSNTVV
jgi:hypothetical protein